MPKGIVKLTTDTKGTKEGVHIIKWVLANDII